MSAPSETKTPWTHRLPAGRLDGIFTWAWRACMFMGVVVLIYLRTIFATHDNVREAVAPYAALPAKVQSLDEFRGRQEKAQEQTNTELRSISTAQATTNAILSEQARTNTRILDQLERINARAARQP